MLKNKVVAVSKSVLILGMTYFKVKEVSVLYPEATDISEPLLVCQALTNGHLTYHPELLVACTR